MLYALRPPLSALRPTLYALRPTLSALRPTLFALCLILCANPAVTQQISVFPPQIHQQITPEGEISRDLQVFNTGSALLEFTCRFEPWNGSRDTTVSWVSAGPMAGAIEPGDTALIRFDFNSYGLDIENYLVNFMIASNDTANPDLEVLAMLHVMDLVIFITPEKDSIDPGDSVKTQVFVFGGTENYQYEWSSNPPGFTSTLKEPTLRPTTSSWFILKVTDGGYSRNDSVFIRVTPSSGTDEHHPHLHQLKVSPNPGREHIQVSFVAEHDSPGMVRVINLSGVPVYTRDIGIMRGHNEIRLETGNFPGGAYLVVVGSLRGYHSAIYVICNM